MRQVKKKQPRPPASRPAVTRPAAAPRPAHYVATSFQISAQTLAQCPADTGWEIAFAGRSNAGKSSALNCLTSARLARTSKTPGRTQLINFFRVDEERRLVDLPGYGYAKVPEAMRREWGRHLGDYVSHRQCLCGMVVMMDIRHPLTDFDRQLLDVAVSRNLPVHVLLTKSDKLKRGPAKNQLQAVRNELKKMPGQLSVQLFSSLKNEGLAEAWQVLDRWLELAPVVEVVSLPETPVDPGTVAD